MQSFHLSFLWILVYVSVFSFSSRSHINPSSNWLVVAARKASFASINKFKWPLFILLPLKICIDMIWCDWFSFIQSAANLVSNPDPLPAAHFSSLSSVCNPLVFFLLLSSVREKKDGRQSFTCWRWRMKYAKKRKKKICFFFQFLAVQNISAVTGLASASTDSPLFSSQVEAQKGMKSPLFSSVIHANVC